MKKNQFVNIVLILFILAAVSCKKAEVVPAELATPAFDMAAAKTAVETGYKEFEKAFDAKDSIALANCYAIDAKFMHPNGKAVEGRANIQKLFGQWMKGDTTKMTLKLAELWGNETNLTAENSWEMTDKEGKVVDAGKSLEVYKLEEGKWKLLRDCYNSDMPIAK